MQQQSLFEKSKWFRQEIFNLVTSKKRGHIPSCFSSAEILISLFYGGFINLNKDNHLEINRDRLLISKGHAAMAVYPILADLGIFDPSEMQRFCEPAGLLRMYADRSIPGVESVNGSLGHGLGTGLGFGLAAKRDGRKNKTFVILGDGELYEGSVWEALLFGAHHQLDNVIAIVDRNGLCIMEHTESCIRLDPIDEKIRAFGWTTEVVDGHSYSQLIPALERATQNTSGKPYCIVANTIKGKGISFMEDRHDWHNKMPNPEQMVAAREELNKTCIVN